MPDGLMCITSHLTGYHHARIPWMSWMCCKGKSIDRSHRHCCCIFTLVNLLRGVLLLSCSSLSFPNTPPSSASILGCLWWCVWALLYTWWNEAHVLKSIRHTPSDCRYPTRLICLQSIVADSPNDAEYVGMYEAVVATMGIKNLLVELGADPGTPLIYEDNDGARRLAMSDMG